MNPASACYIPASRLRGPCTRPWIYCPYPGILPCRSWFRPVSPQHHPYISYAPLFAYLNPSGIRHSYYPAPDASFYSHVSHRTSFLASILMSFSVSCLFYCHRKGTVDRELRTCGRYVESVGALMPASAAVVDVDVETLRNRMIYCSWGGIDSVVSYWVQKDSRFLMGIPLRILMELEKKALATYWDQLLWHSLDPEVNQFRLQILKSMARLSRSSGAPTPLSKLCEWFKGVSPGRGALEGIYVDQSQRHISS